ncbi:MAG: ferrous iron transport protein A [Bacilli bacterium]|nr:ferrous iron transport protein A [Bacilli bacterium]
MPIVIAPLDTELTIKKVLVDEKTKKHLESLGVVIGGKISVISTHGGNVICIVKGVRLGLNSDIARKILVA